MHLLSGRWLYSNRSPVTGDGAPSVRRLDNELFHIAVNMCILLIKLEHTRRNKRDFITMTNEGNLMPSSPELVANIIDNIRRVFQVVYEHSKVVERETGLTGSQMWAIKVIAEASSIKPSELAKRMYLHPATVVGLIDRLVKKGLVSRTRSEEDRRIVEISLTESGKGLLAFSPEVTQGILARGLENLPQEKIVTVADGLQELVKILGAEELPPHLILSPDVNLPFEDKTAK